MTGRLALRLSALALAAIAGFSTGSLWADDPWIVFEGGDGPGKGKHIVLISGDDEYRSEEAFPQLAKMLSKHHGFKCTVLFSIDPETGFIKPNHDDKSPDHTPGIEALKTADLAVLGLRFRNLPDEQMQHFVDYIESGKPVIGTRTSTHSFSIPQGHKFEKYTWTSDDKSYEKGFGKQVLGETWISHHGAHGSQSTRGLIAKGQEGHAILRGIKDGDIWGPSDVYGVTLPLPGDSQPLVMGQILKGMKFDDAPLEGPKNEPMMPVAWTKSYKSESGKVARVFTTTMGAATDLEAEGTRRLLVNAVFWAVGLEDQIAYKTNVELVGEFKPTKFGFNGFAKGKKPADYAK